MAAQPSPMAGVMAMFGQPMAPGTATLMPLPGVVPQAAFPWGSIAHQMAIGAAMGGHPQSPVTILAHHPGAMAAMAEKAVVVPSAPLLPTQGNDKANMDERLWQNIQDSNYYKGLFELRTVEDVLERAETSVKYVNAWGDQAATQRRGSHFIVASLSGSAHLSGMRGWVNVHHQPSPAWCIIARLHVLKVTVDQMEHMMNHSSPYIRCIGLIYLRLVLPPKDLWEWFEEHVKDNTELVMTDKPNLRTTTVREVAVGLLTELKFLDTRFPRIAELVMRNIRSNLSKLGVDVGSGDSGQPSGGTSSSGGAGAAR
eukprot:RCo008573